MNPVPVCRKVGTGRVRPAHRRSERPHRPYDRSRSMLLTSFTSADERWDAVARREGAADGRFVYAVTTTGVFCRPSCASRLPNRRNVRFFDTTTEAARAGFRACKRCRPGAEDPRGESAALVVRACRLLEGEGRVLAAEVARAIGWSPSYFQR